MAAETRPILHALAVVNGSGQYKLNQGFARMGFDRARDSYRLGAAHFQFRLLAPVACIDGAGAALGIVTGDSGFTIVPSQTSAVVSYDPADPAIVNVKYNRNGAGRAGPFAVVVWRFPQVQTR